VQSWVKHRCDVLAPTTLRNLYTWLKAIMAAAVEDGIIARSPCTSKITLPERRDEEIVPLTLAQVRRLADAMPDRYRAAVYLQAACGLRISELLAIQVGDIDFLRRTVRVERQLIRDGHGFGPPKTRKSRRTIPLAADVVPILAEHLRLYPPNADGVVLTTTKGNPIRQDVYSDTVFRPAVARSGLPASTTSHDLRHHFASVLVSRCVPVNVVAKYLGHSSAALVLSTYAHCMPDADDQVRTELDALWSTACVTDVSPALGLRAANLL